jgi:hypothetical protein
MARHQADTCTVSFRLDGHHHKMLVERAAARGLTPGTYARLLTVEALDNVQSLQTLATLQQLQHDVGTLKENVRLATICVLTELGRWDLTSAETEVNKLLME